MYAKYIYDFIKKAKLIPESGKVVVAVSGGLDSMALLDICVELRKRGLLKEVQAIHINHGTRVENLQEEELVKTYCKNNEVKIYIKKLNMNFKMKNFEFIAHKNRYREFLSQLHLQDLLYTAHHIDDSFEWSLMQQFKTTSLRPTLGIPVVKGCVGRPFMCMSKEQIKRYVRIKKVPFLEDASNRDISFERNFIREIIIKKIKSRFPSYLKNYVYRSNILAQELKISVFHSFEKLPLKIVKDKWGGIALIHPDFERDFSSYESEIIETVKRVSKSERGTLRLQVQKIIEASKNSKKGPLTFSGDVYGYVFWGVVYIISKENLRNTKKLDDLMLNDLITLKGAYIPVSTQINLLKQNLFSKHSFFIKSENPDYLKKKKIKKIHPLFPKTTQFAIENKINLFEWGRFMFLTKEK